MTPSGWGRHRDNRGGQARRASDRRADAAADPAGRGLRDQVAVSSLRTIGAAYAGGPPARGVLRAAGCC